MAWYKALRYLLPAAWTFLPMFLLERQADIYFLSDNLAGFYTISGWRLVLFIIIGVVGSIPAGASFSPLCLSNPHPTCWVGLPPPASMKHRWGIRE